MSIFTRLNTAVQKRVAYNRTVYELETLPLNTRLDLDIYAGDIPQIAARAVYGR